MWSYFFAAAVVTERKKAGDSDILQQRMFCSDIFHLGHDGRSSQTHQTPQSKAARLLLVNARIPSGQAASDTPADR